MSWAGLAAAGLACGCALKALPVRGYVPNPPVDPAPGLSQRIAVAPFQDRSDRFKFKGRKFPYLDGTFNLLRGGDGGYFVPALEPKSVSGFLRDDLEAAGAFASVKLVNTRSEAARADVVIYGSIDKAEYLSRASVAGGVERLTLSLTLRAEDPAGRLLWEKPFYSVEDIGGPDRLISQAVISTLRDFFAAARRDLLAVLSPKK
ncbi:MAG: hypothetical protein PHF00_10870 [Elusimicrobia bacterium]|nr:hypothetical protein [Elusimicrobiota bacterium]